VSDIIFERRGAAGVVVLNRPHALNALTHAMVRALTGKLAEWADDPAITRVIVTAAGGRAFCAGGDVRELYELGRSGRHDEALRFLHVE
jgi:enoyl-CoA hydratase